MPAGIDSVPTWMPAMMGATVGGLYAALNRAGMRKFWRSPSTQLNVLITGGGKGEPSVLLIHESHVMTDPYKVCMVFPGMCIESPLS